MSYRAGVSEGLGLGLVYQMCGVRKREPGDRMTDGARRLIREFFGANTVAGGAPGNRSDGPGVRGSGPGRVRQCPAHIGWWWKCLAGGLRVAGEP